MVTTNLSPRSEAPAVNCLLFTLEDRTVELGAIVISSIVTGLGILFNVVLLVAIIKRTPRLLKSYAVLLFNFALVDLLASIGSMMTMQRLLFSGWAITYVFNGPCRFVHPYLCYFVHCFNCHVFAHFQWILLISFIYRYWILVKATPAYGSVIKLTLLVYIPSVLALLPYALRNSPTEVIRNIMKEHYPEYNLDDVVVAGNAFVLEWSTIITVIYMVTPCPWVYCAILYYRKKTLDYLNQSGDLSETTRNQHKKMIKALTIQACIPFFYLGGAMQYALGTFHIISGQLFEHGTFMSMEMMPMLTPLISLYFIMPYRNAVLSWMRLRKFKRRIGPSINSISNTISPGPSQTNKTGMF